MNKRGFTLIEVMVALAVFSVVSIALVRNTTLGLRQAGMIEERTVAWWIAENEMTELRVLPRSDEDYPRLGTSREVVEMAGIAWELETSIEATENDYIRRVVIRVYRDSSEEPGANLVGFLGRY